MEGVNKAAFDIMKFSWLSTRRIMEGKCDIIHEGSCLIEYLRKAVTVFQIGMKYYVPFHLIPFLLSVKRFYKKKQLPKFFLKTLKNYVFSILFMVFLVCNIKGGLCIASRISMKLNGYYLFYDSFIASLSIFFQGPSRRRELAFYFISKACRAVYMNFKRTYSLKFENESKIVVTLLFGAYYYLVNEQLDSIKQGSLIKQAWGIEQKEEEQTVFDKQQQFHF